MPDVVSCQLNVICLLGLLCIDRDAYLVMIMLMVVVKAGDFDFVTQQNDG